MCGDQENILRELKIPYKKYASNSQKQDPIDCETENYLPWNESQYLIQDYGIQAIPVIIQGNKTRTGMMYWDLEKERNDLITQLHVSCQNGVCV